MQEMLDELQAIDDKVSKEANKWTSIYSTVGLAIGSIGGLIATLTGDVNPGTAYGLGASFGGMVSSVLSLEAYRRTKEVVKIVKEIKEKALAQKVWNAIPEDARRFIEAAKVYKV